MNDIDRFYDLSGLWLADIGDGKQYSASLPGTLDENGIGYEDSGSGPVHPDEALGTQLAIFHVLKCVFLILGREIWREI